MKKFLVILLMALTVTALFANGDKEAPPSENVVIDAANAYFGDFPGSRIVPAETVFQAIDAGEEIMILDIRAADAYAEGHLKGAVNAPWGTGLAAAVSWIPEDIPVYVQCYSGQTAGQATAVLNVAGVQAQSIKYGWNLGVSKTEGYEKYVTTEAAAVPEASGSTVDPSLKRAAADYFKAAASNGNNILAAAKVKDMIDAGEDMTIVSVRQPADYAAGHIKGAINITYGAGMQENFSDLSTSDLIVVYCYSGQTAGQTVGILRLLGYDAVSLKSGMGTAGTGASGWANEGFEVVQ